MSYPTYKSPTHIIFLIRNNMQILSKKIYSFLFEKHTLQSVSKIVFDSWAVYLMNALFALSVLLVNKALWNLAQYHSKSSPMTWAPSRVATSGRARTKRNGSSRRCSWSWSAPPGSWAVVAFPLRSQSKRQHLVRVPRS